jgi:hypothetical protein
VTGISEHQPLSFRLGRDPCGLLFDQVGCVVRDGLNRFDIERYVKKGPQLCEQLRVITHL